MYQKYIKRLLDIILSIILLIVTSPIMLIITIALIFENKGKIIYMQERTGIDMKKFKIIKFSSVDLKINSINLQKEKKVTPVGKIIRATSMDELPQFINVIKGDMSLVGPRPMPSIYDSHFTEEQKERFKVKPGITGLAQIHGRINLSITKTLQYDRKYVKNITFRKDAKIFFKTFTVILCKENNIRIKNHVNKNIQELEDGKKLDKTIVHQKKISN